MHLYRTCTALKHEGTGETLVLKGQTHLWRLPDSDRLHIRSFSNAPELARRSVVIDITGYHAVIDEKDGVWSLSVLSSPAPTLLNGIKIRHGKGHQLGEGDRITFGSSSEFIFAECMLNIRQALLVGFPGADLRGIPTDIMEMSRALISKGFEVNTLVNDDASHSNVLRSLDRMAGILMQNSFFIFYFSGHGNGGLYLKSGILTPSELYTRLKAIPGNKIVILDNCDGGSFLDGKPNEILLLAASRKGEKAYEGQVISLLSNSPISYFTHAIVKLLDDYSAFDPIDFKRDIGFMAMNDPRLIEHSQTPHISGKTILCFAPSH